MRRLRQAAAGFTLNAGHTGIKSNKCAGTKCAVRNERKWIAWHDACKDILPITIYVCEPLSGRHVFRPTSAEAKRTAAAAQSTRRIIVGLVVKRDPNLDIDHDVRWTTYGAAGGALGNPISSWNKSRII